MATGRPLVATAAVCSKYTSAWLHLVAETPQLDAGWHHGGTGIPPPTKKRKKKQNRTVTQNAQSCQTQPMKNIHFSQRLSGWAFIAYATSICICLRGHYLCMACSYAFVYVGICCSCLVHTVCVYLCGHYLCMLYSYTFVCVGIF